MDTSNTQRARIADDLLRSIRDHSFPVGSKLPSERKLSEQYAVSRPVIREALGMLTTLDVIDVQMGRGAFVTNADVAIETPNEFTLIDIVDAREVIESGALRLAAARATDATRAGVAEAFFDLERAVASGSATTDADVALHRAIVHSAASAKLARLWSDMTHDITQTVRISPHGRTMNSAILDEHRVLAEGITLGRVAEATTACAALYDDHRQFLRTLLG